MNPVQLTANSLLLAAGEHGWRFVIASVAPMTSNVHTLLDISRSSLVEDER